MKISNTFLVIIISLISVGFFFLKRSDDKINNLMTLDYINVTRVDSIRNYDNGYFIYTKNHLLKVKITKYERFVSPADTTLTVIDTSGKQIVTNLSVGKINTTTQNRIIELISLVK